MNFKRISFFTISLIVTANRCFADSGIQLDVNDLMYLFYTSMGISILALVVSISNYIFNYKALNITAWIFTLLSVFTSRAFVLTDYIQLSAILPCTSITLLLSKISKTSKGNKFLLIYLLRSIASLVVILIAGKLILGNLFQKTTPFTGILYYTFILFLSNIALGAFLYNMLVRPNNKPIIKQNIISITFIGQIIGFGAYFICLAYLSAWYHAENRPIKHISSIILQNSYLNIYLNAICWFITSILVYVMHEPKKYSSQSN